MAKPSKKSPAMNEFLSRVMGRDRVSTIKADKCMTCGKDADKFDDELSKKEYAISGMCQFCQNLAYGPGEEKALVEP